MKIPTLETLKREGHHVPESRCTRCGQKLDGARAASHPGNPPPSPGDITGCTNCGHAMIFAADLRLRDPTPVEWEEIRSHPDYQALFTALRHKHH